jgi:hypothetical protein
MRIWLGISLAAFLSVSPATLHAGSSESFEATQGGPILSESAREDLGDIREEGVEPFKPTFRGHVSATGQYVTNARLEGDHSSSDFLFQPLAEVGMNIPLGHGLDFDVVARVEAVSYSAFSSRNFFGFSGAATLAYRYRNSLPRIFLGVEPYWYSGFSGDYVGSAIGFTAGTDHEITLNRGKTMLFGGYKFTRFYAAPRLNDRDEHLIILGVTHQFTSRLFGQLYYSIQFAEFLERDRSDVRNAVGLTGIYQFADNLFGNVTATLVDNNSGDDLFSHQNFGLGIGVTYQF